MAADRRKNVEGLGGGDPIARARSVVAAVAVAAPRIDAARELPADLVAKLHDARLFRLLLPKSLGGDEVDLATFGAVIETIAAADASTAWCLSQGGGCAMAAAYLSSEAASRLFGADNAVLAWGAGIQGKARKVAGGYRVTGKWTFASGSRHATLLGGHSYVFDENGEPVRRADGRQLDRSLLFAREQAKIHDIWHVVGLKGTGSDTYEVADLFVRDADTVDRENPAELQSTSPIFIFAATLAYGVGFSSLMLGIARGIIDDLKALAMTKTPRGASMSLRDNPVFQAQLALFEARYGSLRAYLQQTSTELFSEVSASREITLEQKVRLKLATTFVINQGVEIVTEAYRAAGQTAIFEGSSYERRMRDALTASQQTQGRTSNFITIGRCMLGLDPDTMMFLA